MIMKRTIVSCGVMTRPLTAVLLALAVSLLVGMSAQAQVKVESRISSMEMLVGEQVAVTVTATAPADAVVTFPTETLLPDGIEFMGAIDNPDEKAEGGLVSRSKQYVFTSFADTLYYIPPFTVNVDGKDYTTNKLALKVLTVDVDTTDYDKYYGPKDVQDPPFLWSEWKPVFWLSVVMLLLLALVYYLYLRMRDNKPVIARIRVVKRLMPHQKAMAAIETIKQEHMQNAEDPKEYYTRLTDALRHYIEERYGFSAMEMTSSEIIERLLKTDDQQSLDELRQLFQTADLVKFAKYSTLLGENDANLMNAIEFINQTKQEVPPSETAERAVRQQLTAEEQRSQKSRFLLKMAIGYLLVVCLLIFIYVAYSVYTLL